MTDRTRTHALDRHTARPAGLRPTALEALDDAVEFWTDDERQTGAALPSRLTVRGTTAVE